MDQYTLQTCHLGLDYCIVNYNLQEEIPRKLCEVTRSGPKAVSASVTDEAINCGWDAHPGSAREITGPRALGRGV